MCEFHLEDLPLLGREPALDVSGEGLAGLRVSGVFEVVVADGELSVGFFDVRAIDYADVATAENWAFLGVAGDGELGEVKVELFLEVDGEDEGVHGFVGRPVFLAGIPCQRSIPTDDLTVLRLN